MQDLKKLDTSILIDMLARDTTDYTTRIAQRNTVKLGQYEYDIAMIQAELNSRKMERRDNEHPAGVTRRIRSSNGGDRNR